MKTCENCLEEHDGEYGSGRFCNTICSHAYSSKCNKDQKNKNISKALKKKKRHSFQHLPIETRRKMTKAAIASQKKRKEELYKNGKWDELPLSYKRRRVFEEQDGKCAICKIDEWQGKPLTLHFDHIDGNSKNDSRENVRFVCPNCHSQTETYCGKKQKLPQFEHLKTTKEKTK